MHYFQSKDPLQVHFPNWGFYGYCPVSQSVGTRGSAESATPVAAEKGKPTALTTESATAFLRYFFDSP